MSKEKDWPSTPREWEGKPVRLPSVFREIIADRNLTHDDLGRVVRCILMKTDCFATTSSSALIKAMRDTLRGMNKSRERKIACRSRSERMNAEKGRDKDGTRTETGGTRTEKDGTRTETGGTQTTVGEGEGGGEGEGLYKNPPTPKGEKREVFQKPTVEDVEAYCKERGNGVSPQAFCDYYDSVGWKVGKKTMKDWRACVRTWEQRDGRGPKKVMVVDEEQAATAKEIKRRMGLEKS